MALTPFQVYLVMQLDSISTLAFILGVLSAIVFTIFFICYVLDNAASKYHPELSDSKAEAARAEMSLGIAKKAGVLAALSLTLGTFLPSTKTAAAMIVLPAIVNSQTVQTEAGELYGLAKEGLRNLVKSNTKSTTADTENNDNANQQR